MHEGELLSAQPGGDGPATGQGFAYERRNGAHRRRASPATCGRREHAPWRRRGHDGRASAAGGSSGGGLACMSSSRFSTRPRKSTAGRPWSSNRHVVCASMCSSSQPKRRLQQPCLQGTRERRGRWRVARGKQHAAVARPAHTVCLLGGRPLVQGSGGHSKQQSDPGNENRQSTWLPHDTARGSMAAHTRFHVNSDLAPGRVHINLSAAQGLTLQGTWLRSARAAPQTSRKSQSRVGSCRACARGASWTARAPRGCAQTRRLHGNWRRAENAGERVTKTAADSRAGLSAGALCFSSLRRVEGAPAGPNPKSAQHNQTAQPGCWAWRR